MSQHRSDTDAVTMRRMRQSQHVFAGALSAGKRADASLESDASRNVLKGFAARGKDSSHRPDEVSRQSKWPGKSRLADKPGNEEPVRLV